MEKAETIMAETAGQETRIAAHRAGAALWPENSMTAFRNALLLDVDFIEFDIHRSRDGVLVVHHDAVLGRTAAGSGTIGQMEWRDLRRATLHGTKNEHMPLLAEVLALMDGSAIRPRLELKTDPAGQIYPGMTAAAMTMIAACGLLERTIITSFHPPCLDEALTCGAHEVLWLLDQEATDDLLSDIPAFASKALGRGIGEIAIRGADATAELVQTCAANGLILGAYAGKDMDFARLFGIGLSVFTSDRPDLAVAARNVRRYGKPSAF